MNKLHTLSLAGLFAASAQGQVTITQAEMPSAGDQLIRVKAVTNPFINYGATGTAYTWNFANLAADVGDTTSYRTVASTNFVYAIFYADIFFNANRANHAKSGTDIAFSQLLPITNPYTFRYRSSTQYKTVGFGAEVSGIPLPVVFDEHDVIYELPLDFGNTSTSHSRYHIDIPNVGYYGFEQDRTNVVDGWGALTTPGGSFDVIRVKTTLAMHDSLFGIAIDRPLVREYKWMTPGLRVPVLQVNTTTIFGAEVVTGIYYYDVPRGIQVGTPLANSLCPGATPAVNFTATGAYNAGGFFVPANQFTAQLSDATGSFAAPVNIGSLTATASGTINVTIPSTTQLGSGYRIRVISSSPSYIGTSNSFNINIGGATVASISAQGSTLICTDGEVLLTAIGGPSYQWQHDGMDIPDATQAQYTATEAGSYSVRVDNACGLAASNSIQVEVNELPIHTVDATAYLVCAGSAVSFAAHDASDQTDLTYQWLLNDAPVVGATDSTIEATLGGQYTAVISNASTGCSYTTEAVQVSVEALPDATVMTDGSTALCPNGSVVLSVSAGQENGFQWFVDGNGIAEANGPSLVVDVPGDYEVVITTPSACVSEPVPATTVTMDTVSAPIVVATEPTTFCEGGGTFLVADPVIDLDHQWLENGSLIDGATGAQLLVSTSGMFSLMVTTANGCSATSAPIEVIVHPLPAAPMIDLENGALLANGVGTYQWSLNGLPLDGATGVTWEPLENGSYTVELTDENGCSSISEAYVVLTTGMALTGIEGLRISPNPSAGNFMIQMAGAAGLSYEILDATGKQVQQGMMTGARRMVSMSDPSNGVYFLRLKGEDHLQVVRFVIAH